MQVNKAQTTNDVLNLLIQRNVISQEEADSLRADAAIKQQESDSKKKSFAVNAGKTIQLSGYTQVRYQNLEQTGKKPGFDVRRARLTAKGNISPYFTYTLQPEFAGASARLLDAFGEFKISPFFNLSVGQQKISFTRESQESDNKYDFIDRSVAVQALSARNGDVIGDQNGRDLGVQAFGTFKLSDDKPLVDYWLGIFNGTGINAVENNTSKDVSARILLHPYKGLEIGASYYDGVGNYLVSNGSNHLRKRWGLELHYEFKDLSVQGEYLKGQDGVIKKDGYYAQAGYFVIPQKWEVVVKYDTFDPDNSKDNDRTKLYFAGINYTFNSSTRFQIGYDVRQKQGGGTNTNYAVAQFTIGF